MKRIHILGRKNHGKTTLVVELVQAFANRGLRVGTIKHTHHHHELDSPGKDSHRHRESGAVVVGICSPSMNAVFWPNDRDAVEDQQTKYAAFEPMFDDCDLVVVEGDTQTDAMKVEVWRRQLGTEPLSLTDRSITAMISDDALETEIDIPIWPRSSINAICEKLLELLG